MALTSYGYKLRQNNAMEESLFTEGGQVFFSSEVGRIAVRGNGTSHSLKSNLQTGFAALRLGCWKRLAVSRGREMEEKGFFVAES